MAHKGLKLSSAAMPQSPCRFSPPLCEFCQGIILHQITLHVAQESFIAYPKNRARKPLMSDTCGLCKYVLSILKAEHAQVSEEDWKAAVAINAVCFPMDE